MVEWISKLCETEAKLLNSVVSGLQRDCNELLGCLNGVGGRSDVSECLTISYCG